MRWEKLCLLIICFLVLGSPLDAAEDPFLQEQETPVFDNFTIDWGVMLELYILDSNTTDQKSSFISDTKVYLNFVFSENTFLYLRGRNYLQYTPHPNVDLNRDKLEDILDLDQAFFQTQGNNYRVIVGRAIYQLGLGILFNNNADGAQFLFKSGIFSAQVLANYTGLIRKDFDTFKQSIYDFESGSKRVFAGGLFGIRLESNQIFNLGFLMQTDVQDYTILSNDEYQSRYGVFAWENELLKNFFFLGEFIYEFGSSPGGEESISAYAADARFRFVVGTKANLSFLLQYAVASGDSDRNNVFLGRGNESGQDTNFKAFGQYYTGFSFQPRFSNIQSIRFVSNGNPFFFADFFKGFYGSLHYSVYFKHTKDALISDVDVTRSEVYIGQAVDFFVNWRLLSDLTYILKVGIFFKGSAFESSIPVGLLFTGFQLQF